jgi:deoxyguanosine kinase
MYSYIAIEGVIGAGKTTLAKFLAEALPAKLILEEFENNPFLVKFYKDRDKFAFPLELSFLASRYHQVKNELDQRDIFGAPFVSDFVLYKSLVFASINLKDEESILYRKLFDIMFQQIPVPDITFYIYHSLEDLKRNIRKRGRDYELNISDSYLEQLNENYLNYFKQLTHHRIVVLNGREFNIEENPDAKTRLLKLVSSEFPLGLNYI